MRIIAALFFLSFVAAGCAVQPTPITAEPEGVFVSVNSVGIGAAPTQYTFDFSKTPSYAVHGSKTGFFDADVNVNPNTTLREGAIHLALQADDSWVQTTTTDANNKWLRIQVAPGLKADAMWQKLIDSITGRYSSLEQMDVASGYVRSVAIAKTYHHPVNGDFIIRTQFLGAMASKEPLVYKIKITAEKGDNTGRWTPYDRVFKEDAELVDELQTRLGTR